MNCSKHWCVMASNYISMGMWLELSKPMEGVFHCCLIFLMLLELTVAGLCCIRLRCVPRDYCTSKLLIMSLLNTGLCQNIPNGKGTALLFFSTKSSHFFWSWQKFSLLFTIHWRSSLLFWFRRWISGWPTKKHFVKSEMFSKKNLINKWCSLAINPWDWWKLNRVCDSSESSLFLEVCILKWVIPWSSPSAL